ncbi:MAG: hypothetical protein IH852_07335 [Bacteroidetes bacterium]|nr:hypothetical protein [Bacteroidota bacterium]
MPNKVRIDIDGNNRGAVTAINGVSTKLLGMERQAGTSSQKMGTSFSKMGGMIGGLKTKLALMGVAAVTAFGYMIKSAIDTAESLEKMSQRVGLSVEFLSTLRHATELSGTEISVMEKAVQRMSRTLFDANRGLLTAQIPFKELGIAVSDSMGQLRNGEVIILEVADRFSKMKDGTEKTALALQIFGRAGADLIPLLNSGADGIRRMQEEARALGLEISTKTAKNAAELKDNMLRLERSVTRVVNKIAEGLIPVLNGLVTSLSSIPTDLIRVAGEAGALLLVIRSLGWAVNALNIKVLASRAAFLKSGWGILIVAAGTLAAELLIVEKSTEKLDKGLNKNTKSLDWMDGNLRRVGNRLIRITKESAGLTDEQIKALEILNKQWAGISSKLQKDILLLGLNPQHKKMIELNLKAEEYRQRFGSVPGAMTQISNWYDTLIFKAAALNEISARGLGIPEGGEKFEPTPLVDTTQIDAAHQAQIDGIMRVSDFELANWALREAAASGSFAMMSGAAQAYYEAFGNAGRKGFGIYKAFAIGEAVMATYLAADKALGTVPFPFNIPVMASIITMGLANVAKISAMQPGSSGGGVPSYSAPALPGNVVNNQSTNTRNFDFNITIINQGNLDPDELDAIARQLIGSLRKAENDGA